MLQTSIHVDRTETIVVKAEHGGEAEDRQSYWIEIGVWKEGELRWRSMPEVRVILFCADKEHQHKMLMELSGYIERCETACGDSND